MVFSRLKTFVFILVTSFFIGCGDENSYDGVNGLISSDSTLGVDESVQAIFDNVIYKDANETYNKSVSLISMIEDLNSSTTESNLQLVQDGFKDLILSYKKVESVYVAGYNNDNMRVVAEFYLEHYIKGSKSQDTAGDLESVFDGNRSLVANSLKGITALEYTLFGDRENLSELVAKMNQNRLDAASLMINKISSHLFEVLEYYENTSSFATSGEDSINALLNTLVQQALNLREMRIGEPAGLTIKYAGDSDATRLEYYYSSYSLEAIKEILKTHKRVLQNGLESIADEGSASSEAEAIRVAIDEALSICDSYAGIIDDELATQKTNNLFESVRTVQNNYTALIAGLNFQQDILDADGD